MCSNNLTKLKKEIEWLKEVDSVALQQSLKDLDFAYKNFYKRVKNREEKFGFPKFKSKKNNKLSYRTNNEYRKDVRPIVEIKNNKIKLPKLKWVKFKDNRVINGIIKNCTISKSLIPKSIPISLSFKGNLSISCSTNIDTKFLLVKLLDIVQFFIMPLMT